jgi:hypothetical protein
MIEVQVAIRAFIFGRPAFLLTNNRLFART